MLVIERRDSVQPESVGTLGYPNEASSYSYLAQALGMKSTSLYLTGNQSLVSDTDDESHLSQVNLHHAT
jgi:hypothetical protein